MRQRINRSSLVLGLLVLAAVVSTRWLRLNMSPSVPYGLYRLAPVPATLHRGDLVVLLVPASVQPWQAWWVPLLKPVAGVAGDCVCHRDHILYVNGTAYGLVYQEAYGKPLPQIEEGCFVVQPGHVFLASVVPKSLDSRYYGAVPLASLTAQATPLWIWR